MNEVIYKIIEDVLWTVKDAGVHVPRVRDPNDGESRLRCYIQEYTDHAGELHHYFDLGLTTRSDIQHIQVKFEKDLAETLVEYKDNSDPDIKGFPYADPEFPNNLVQHLLGLEITWSVKFI